MERKKSSFSPLTLSGKDVMVNLIIRLTEVELTTGSIRIDEPTVWAASDKAALKALEQLSKLSGCQAHTSVMLSEVDIKIFKRLGIQLTMEPRYENDHIYH